MQFLIFSSKAGSSLTGKSQLLKKNQQGFTLLELLISMTVFVMITTASLGIYSFSLKAYQRSVEVGRMQGEMALLMELLTKRIRSSQVDYAWYGGLVDCPLHCQPVLTLALVDQDGMFYRIRAEGGDIKIDAGGTGTYQTFNSERITVADLRFSIGPSTNPFTSSQPPTSQPRVIVTVTVTPRGKTQPALVIEQSVPQRSGI